ncbi:hypothetical protein TRVL_02436 [Trypanosoma vivax]|nr:hypothetical protein TRVL_02436 [Trypanosoma vivax]
MRINARGSAWRQPRDVETKAGLSLAKKLGGGNAQTEEFADLKKLEAFGMAPGERRYGKEMYKGRRTKECNERVYVFHTWPQALWGNANFALPRSRRNKGRMKCFANV